MTIDEAIQHAEEVAEKQEELYRLCPASESEMSHCDGTKDCKTLKSGKNKGCQKCAEEHRQLVEWLKDYKQLKLQQHKQSSDRNIEEIAEIMQSDVDAETKCKMISNILTAKPHYFELDRDEFEPITSEEMQKCRDIVKKYTPKQQPCDDAVSRQEVLDQTYLWSKDEFLRVTNPFDYLRKRINSLQPVTLKQNIEHCKNCR